MNKRLKIFLYRIFLFAYMGAIFALSASSHPLPFLVNFEKYHFDWVFHGVEYAILGFLLAKNLDLSFKDRRWSRRLLLIVTLILGSSFGITDEWHQHFTPMRDPSIFDWMADTVGVWVGALIYS